MLQTFCWGFVVNGMTLFSNTFLGKNHVLSVFCFGGRVLRKTVIINHENRRAITGAPNISKRFIRKCKLLPLQCVSLYLGHEHNGHI
mgnify:CR=1 FL=1